MNDVAKEKAEKKTIAGGIAKCSGKWGQEYPERYTVVDTDMSADYLMAVHDHDPKSQAVIRAAVQLRRNSATAIADPVQWGSWVKSLMTGVTEPILYVPLTDKEGVERAIVVSGNMRNLGLRDANKIREEKTPPKSKLEIRGIPQLHVLSGTPEEVFHKVLALKTAANVRVPMLITAKAEEAIRMQADSVNKKEMAFRLEVPGERQVDDLLAIGELMALRKLSDKTLIAIDAGTCSAQRARILSKWPHDRQDKELGGGEDGDGKGKRDKRAKSPPAIFLTDMRKAARRAGLSEETQVALEFLMAPPDRRVKIAKDYPAIAAAAAAGGFDPETGKIKAMAK